MTEPHTNIPKILQDLNQSHILAYYEELQDENAKDQYLQYLYNLNIAKAINIQETSKDLTANHPLCPYMEEIPSTYYGSYSGTDAEILETYKNAGLRAIAHGHVGVVLLGDEEESTDGVLGIHNPGLPSLKTLFQLNAESIIRLQELSSGFQGTVRTIPWYIMVDNNTGPETIKFFETNAYFGIKKDNIIFFQQHMLPCFDLKGKVLMHSKHKVMEKSDGSGGVFDAIRDCEAMKDINNRKIRFLFMYSIDNLLVKIADPIFIGYCLSKDAECGAKMTEKLHAGEKGAVFCMANGKQCAIPLEEVPQSTLFMKKDDSLVFKYISIYNFFFTVKFVKKIIGISSQLQYHQVKRKLCHASDDGTAVKPVAYSGYSLDKIIFDVLPFADQFALWLVPRNREYADFKVHDKKGSVVSTAAVHALYSLHRSLIEKAGGIVAGDEVEISPLVSYDGEGLNSIVQGKSYTAPVYIHETSTKK